MDRDTAIYLAQKAGISPEWIPIAPALPDFLERFAALCEAHGYQKGVAAFHEAVKMEREACKTACKACENGDPTDGHDGGVSACVRAIGERSHVDIAT